MSNQLKQTEAVAPNSQQARFTLLENLPLFRGLSHNTLAYFLEHAREENCAKGKVLFIQGEEAKFFYLVLRGWVKLFRVAKLHLPAA